MKNGGYMSIIPNDPKYTAPKGVYTYKYIATTSDDYTLCARSEAKGDYLCASEASSGTGRVASVPMFAGWGEGVPANDWLSGWDNRKKLTINQTKIDENLTDLPVLVELTSANFDFSKANSDGFDIRFTSSDGKTLLKYERERYDSANSLAEYWVNVPLVSSTAATDFYIYYKIADTPDGADPENVWDANFKMVQHMKDNTVSTILDSTANNNDGTKIAANQPIETTGKTAKGENFDGNDDAISIVRAIPFGTNPFTVEFWLKAKPGFFYNALFDEGRSWDASRAGYQLFLTNGLLRYNISDGNGHWQEIVVPNSPDLRDDVWHHCVWTYDGFDSRFYLDTGLLTTDPWAYGSGNPTDVFKIGISWINSMYGIIDEFRVSDTARSAAWVKASYNSGNGSLLNYGAEEPSP